ncbi:hypothetical protein KUTeg_006046, partial [Tegillarca granosa]
MANTLFILPVLMLLYTAEITIVILFIRRKRLEEERIENVEDLNTEVTEPEDSVRTTENLKRDCEAACGTGMDEDGYLTATDIDIKEHSFQSLKGKSDKKFEQTGPNQDLRIETFPTKKMFEYTENVKTSRGKETTRQKKPFKEKIFVANHRPESKNVLTILTIYFKKATLGSVKNKTISLKKNKIFKDPKTLFDHFMVTIIPNILFTNNQLTEQHKNFVLYRLYIVSFIQPYINLIASFTLIYNYVDLLIYLKRYFLFNFVISCTFLLETIKCENLTCPNDFFSQVVFIKRLYIHILMFIALLFLTLPFDHHCFITKDSERSRINLFCIKLKL